MSIPLSMPPPAREWLANWLHALAARLSSAREHLRDRIVAVVGDSVAEAVESIVRVLVRAAPMHAPYSLPQPMRSGPYGDEFDHWDNGSFPPEARTEPSSAAPPPQRPRWRPFAFAGLHAAAWWLRRRAAGPLLTALAAVAGAVLLLVD